MTRTLLSFTKFTSITPKLLSKSFSLTDDKLMKTSSADMSEGQAQLMTCADLREFDAVLGSLSGSQALCYGTAPSHPIATIRAAEKLQPGDIARTKEFFSFPTGPGIMMLDHDGTIDGIPIDAEVLYERLLLAVPEFAEVRMLSRISASSCISNAATGAVLNGIKGQRLYLAVLDASLIPEASKIILERLWAVDMGWIEVGKAGQALKRTLIDAAVFQGNRLDFAGPPELTAELTRTIPASRFFGELTAHFDLNRIKAKPEITRKARAAQTKAMTEAKPALQDVRAAYVAATAPEMAARRGISVEAAKGVLQRATDYSTLAGDFELLCQDGTIVTVGEILNRPDQWDGKNFADPLEPGYGNCNKTVARAHLKRGRSPCIRSFAHGGMTYSLSRSTKRIQLATGQRARISDAVVDALRERGDVYDFGEGAGMARIAGSTAVPVSREWLMDHIDRSCEFYKIKPSNSGVMAEFAQDGPLYLPGAIMAKHGERRLPRLDAVVTAPTLRRDGSVLDEPGYDAPSKLLFLCEGECLRIPIAPTPAEALAALKRLWKPVAQFPFVGAQDRAVTLAAMLTAVLRGSLPSAPGFAFDAPSAGSGKTLLAKVIGILATGEEPSVSPPCSDENEMRKRLFALLRDGQQVILLDNLREPLGGESLDAFLTASTYGDRVLGVSETERLPNRALFLCTGNNIRLVGDTTRRVLVARIDSKSEQPYAREFKFDPAIVVASQRQQLVANALTIIRAWFAAGSPRLGKGKTGSFDLWDDLVRQPVVWISTLAEVEGGLPEFADPFAAVFRQSENDPETQSMEAFMAAWYGEFGDAPTTVATAITAANLGNDPLRDALDEIAGQHGNLNPRILGGWLGKHRDRLHRGYRIEQGKVHTGRQTWIVRCEKAAAPTPAVTH